MLLPLGSSFSLMFPPGAPHDYEWHPNLCRFRPLRNHSLCEGLGHARPIAKFRYLFALLKVVDALAAQPRSPILGGRTVYKTYCIIAQCLGKEFPNNRRRLAVPERSRGLETQLFPGGKDVGTGSGHGLELAGAKVSSERTIRAVGTSDKMGSIRAFHNHSAARLEN